MDFAATLTQISSMNIDERIRLVQAIWDSIEAEQAQLDLTEDEKRELDRRIAAHEANPTDVLTWEEIEAYVKRRR
jgi:putative addiction module component (TIGR02574 family)